MLDRIVQTNSTGHPQPIKSVRSVKPIFSELPRMPWICQIQAFRITSRSDRSGTQSRHRLIMINDHYFGSIGLFIERPLLQHASLQRTD